MFCLLKKIKQCFAFDKRMERQIGTYLQASHSRSQTTFSISPSHLDSIFYLILVNSSLQILCRNKSILHPSNMHMPSLNMHMPGAGQVWHFFTPFKVQFHALVGTAAPLRLPIDWHAEGS
jgi:hypothetical protein